MGKEGGRSGGGIVMAIKSQQEPCLDSECKKVDAAARFRGGFGRSKIWSTRVVDTLQGLMDGNREGNNYGDRGHDAQQDGQRLGEEREISGIRPRAV